MPNFTPPLRSNLRVAGDSASRSRNYLEEESGNGDSFHSRILRLREEVQAPVGSPEPVSATALAERDDDLAVVVHELRIENERQKAALDQARQRLEKCERSLEQTTAREAEYERLLEEKSELIRQLHADLQGAGKRTGPAAPNEDELIALHQELERERDQLKQDEEALMSQVREMEIQMSRERADLARQKSELTRLQNELKHQLEIASRDANLRERLGPLYKLQEEIQRRRPQGR
jgi:hypothetical protein